MAVMPMNTGQETVETLETAVYRKTPRRVVMGAKGATVERTMVMVETAETVDKDAPEDQVERAVTAPDGTARAKVVKAGRAQRPRTGSSATTVKTAKTARTLP